MGMMSNLALIAGLYGIAAHKESIHNPLGWGHIGHTAGFGSGHGQSRRTQGKYSGRHHQRKAQIRARRKAVR